MLFLEAPDALPEIDDDFFHDQGGIGASIPTVAPDDMQPGPGQRVEHRQVRAPADRVHKDSDSFCRLVDRFDQLSVQGNSADLAGVGILERRGFLKYDEKRAAFGLVDSCGFHSAIPSTIGYTRNLVNSN